MKSCNLMLVLLWAIMPAGMIGLVIARGHLAVGIVAALVFWWGLVLHYEGMGH